MTPHPLRNFEIQAYYQNAPRFIDVYRGDNLPNKIKHGAYVINLDEYSDIGTHSFGIENIPKEVKKFIGKRNIISNIYRM